MIKRQVLFEPALLRLVLNESKKKGSRLINGSFSGYARRAIKSQLLRDNPQLRNIEGIDWGEAYDL